MTLGSRELAQKIDNHLTNVGRRAPRGWRFVGSGGTRSAYLGPDGVVYKVGDAWCNNNEARAYRELRYNKRMRTQDVYVAKTHAHNLGTDEYGDDVVVNAQQYIPSSKLRVFCNALYGKKCNCRKWGTPRICFAEVLKMLEEMGIEDIFHGNIIYSTDNRFYIIDLGYQE